MVMIMSQILSKVFVSSHNLSEIYVFEVKKSISDIPTELPCLGDLENPGQLPVHGVLEGTDDCMCLIHFWNFFPIYVFEVRKFISDIPTELPCSDDLENPSQLPVQEVLEGTDDFVLWIFTISSVFMFSRSRNPLLTFPMSCYVRVTSKIHVNFRYRSSGVARFLEALVQSFGGGPHEPLCTPGMKSCAKNAGQFCNIWIFCSQLNNNLLLK